MAAASADGAVEIFSPFPLFPLFLIKSPNQFNVEMKLTVLLSLFLIATAALSQRPDKDQAIQVPFEFYKNEIVLQVKVNGKGPYNMMLDTGTNPSAIDLATAKEIGLKLDPIGHQGTGGGTSVNLAYQTNMPVVEIGELRATDVEALAIDLSKIS